VNPIERHLEKVVVGIAGLILLGVIGKFLISSPNKMELGNEIVSPGSVDQKVVQLAASVRQELRSATVSVDPPEPLYDEWLESLDPFARDKIALTLPVTTPFGPEVPIVDEGLSAESSSELMELGALTNAGATYGRTTFVREVGGGDLRYFPTSWVTISAVFDIRTQMQQQKRDWGAARKEVIFASPELQRRARRVDGTWADDDWVDVERWQPVELPTLPSVQLLQDEGEIIVSEDDQDDVTRFSFELEEPLVQLVLVRPLLPEIANGDEWSFPVLTSHRDVLYQDEFYLYPDDASPEEERTKDFAEIERLLIEAWKTKTANMAIMAHNLAAKIKEGRLTPPKDVLKASRLKEQANQMANDIDRIKRMGPSRDRSRDRVTPNAVDVEDEVVREPEPQQQFWVHDARPGSVQGGKTYQYRIRPVIFNRLAGQPQKFRDPQDATVLWIPGKWTDPIEVTLEPTIVFFAASKDERNQQVGLEFFKWFDGIWVRAREKFTIGQSLTFTPRCWAVDFNNPTKSVKALVDINPGLSIIDIDFDSPYRERKRGSSRSGVKFGSATTACSFVLAEADGRLLERYVPTDKGHPAKRQYGTREYRPSK